MKNVLSKTLAALAVIYKSQAVLWLVSAPLLLLLLAYLVEGTIMISLLTLKL